MRGDSCGGEVTCVVRGCPKGLGSPVFDKLEAELAKAFMSLPASKARSRVIPLRFWASPADPTTWCQGSPVCWSWTTVDVQLRIAAHARCEQQRPAKDAAVTFLLLSLVLQGVCHVLPAISQLRDSCSTCGSCTCMLSRKATRMFMKATDRPCAYV